MIPQSLPDWRKIGWHLGKKLHDIFNPSPDSSGPSKEELQAQRLRDVLKGFAYFNTFDEVEAWNLSDVDMLQQANIPLVVRPAYMNSQDSASALKGNRTRTLLCHDFKGGYVDAESIRARPGQDSIYSCEYLQSVHSFIYFSHHLVTVPPPSWTNCLHTNGVKSLGTFILERQTPDIERLLAFGNGHFVIARQLAAMAQTFGFDGWLLNFEKEFNQKSTDHIVDFLDDLKHQLGQDRVLLWYDALGSHNKIEYQNGLTPKNAQFALRVDGIFTNYKWDLQKLHQSCMNAEIMKLPKSHIFFGIDVWAQNNNDSGPPRITFPEKDGGGTNTGLVSHISAIPCFHIPFHIPHSFRAARPLLTLIKAMRTLADADVSAAIFAPSWTHEHFSANLSNFESTSDEVNESLWEGTILPDQLGCDCNGTPHHTSAYRMNSILESAVEYPAGSSEYFHTSFSSALQAYLQHSSVTPEFHPRLGLQSIFPSKTGASKFGASSELSVSKVYKQLPGKTRGLRHSLAIKLKQSSLNASHEPSIAKRLHRLSLYNLNINYDKQLRLRLAYSVPESAIASDDFLCGLYVSCANEFGSDRLEYIPLNLQTHLVHPFTYDFGVPSPDSRITELGIYCTKQLAVEDVELFSCHSLSIIPKDALLCPKPHFSICNFEVVEVEINFQNEKRLQWGWTGDRGDWHDCLPFSRLTGPFSHFSIALDGVEIGISQTLAFPLEERDVRQVLKGTADAVAFTVEGFCFADMTLHERPIVSVTIATQELSYKALK